MLISGAKSTGYWSAQVGREWNGNAFADYSTTGAAASAFNQGAWSGAQASTVSTAEYLPASSSADFAPNIKKFVDKGCELIVGVGFAISAEIVKSAKANPKIEFMWNTEVIDVLGADKVEALKLRNTVDGTESERAFTGLFVAIGHIPRSELLTGQIDLDNEGYVICEGRSTRTNQKGVFACGDLVDHTYRQAITAAGSGCAAALDAEKFLAH